MYLGVYHFDGDTDALLAAFEQAMADVPAGNIGLNVCVARPGA